MSCPANFGIRHVRLLVSRSPSGFYTREQPDSVLFQAEINVNPHSNGGPHQVKVAKGNPQRSLLQVQPRISIVTSLGESIIA